jgi:hypothetical protein
MGEPMADQDPDRTGDRGLAEHPAPDRAVVGADDLGEGDLGRLVWFWTARRSLIVAEGDVATMIRVGQAGARAKVLLTPSASWLRAQRC